MPAASRSSTSTLLQYYIQSDKYNNRDEMWQKDGEFVHDVLLHCQIVKEVRFIMCSEWSGNCSMVLELLVSCTKVQEMKQVQETKDSCKENCLVIFHCYDWLYWLDLCFPSFFEFSISFVVTPHKNIWHL